MYEDYVYNSQPDIEVEFTTRSGKKFRTKELYMYTSQRSLLSPVATAQLVLKGERFIDASNPNLNGQRHIDHLALYDLCTIRILDGSGKSYEDLTGFISILDPKVGVAQGIPQDSTMITVESLGKGLINYHLFWHHHMKGRSNLAGLGFLLRSKGKVPKGRPNEVVSFIFDTFLNDEYAFKLADGRRLNEALIKRFSTFRDALSTTGLSAMGADGSLWDSMKQMADQPWGELFVDVPRPTEVSAAALSDEKKVTNGLPREAVYFRPTPYDLKQWQKLSAPGSGWGFTYSDSERVGVESTPLNSDKIYNFFWCSGRHLHSGFDQLATAFDQSGGKLPIFDESSIKRYGLRRYEQGTRYVETVTTSGAKKGTISGAKKQRANTNKAKWNDVLLEKTRQLHRWYGYQEGFYEGMIPLRGRIGTDSKDGARIGGVLTREDNSRQSYIQSITQNWVFGDIWRTNLGVIRGGNPAKYREFLEEHYRKYGESLAVELQKGD